ncbi:MAG: DUF4358 domain-containing protein [Ruminococcus sp.]|nr:DUF4358 domain-containing protein [Ruminococcus sp.]
MRSKKVISAVLAAAIMTTMAFASCGASSSTADASSKAASSPDSTTAVTASEATTKDVTSIANKLKDSLDDAVKATMTQFDESRIEKMIGVKKDLYKKAVCYVDASGASAHEIDCFEANDENAAKEIETALKARIESQKKAFESYVPAEMDKLNNPVLVVDGSYVFMCLSNNNDKAKEILG